MDGDQLLSERYNTFSGLTNRSTGRGHVCHAACGGKGAQASRAPAAAPVSSPLRPPPDRHDRDPADVGYLAKEPSRANELDINEDSHHE